MRWLPLVMLPAVACGPSPSSDDVEEPDAAVVEPDAEPFRPDADPTEFSRVYAHSGQNLYRIDTTNLDVILVGPFNTGGPSITDIAVDKDDVMIGVSLSKIWSINVDTGAVTEIAAFAGGAENLTSLSFVPLDPNDQNSAERLVAAGDQGNVYEVNTTTGATTLLGNYGLSGGMQIKSSGDIVSVHGVGTLATVTIGTDLSADDFLATIDTTTWAATPIGATSTGYDKIFGLGYWGGTIFGFVDDTPGAQTGTMITIDRVTGVGTPAQSSAFRWFGAGVATDAPVVD